MLENKQYHAAQTECITNPIKYRSILKFLDAMNQTKAFFTNPVKMVANEIPLKLIFFGATLHGYGKTFFYRTEQVKYDSDLSIEVLRHVLLEYEQENGVLTQL